MIIFLCCLFLLFSFLWPFMGGWREMRLREDPLPLFINFDYLKEPRYFSVSFRNLFKGDFDKSDLASGIHEIKLSKTEKVEVFEGGALRNRDEVKDLFYVKNNLSTDSGVVFDKEIYVKGNTVIGRENYVRALASDGEVMLATGTVISRWVDAEDKVMAEDDCDLGISVTSGKEVSIGRGCKFKRLYGNPVNTGGDRSKLENLLSQEYPVYDCVEDSTNIKEIKENTVNDFSIITVHALQIGSNSVINGHIKCFKGVVIGDNVLVTGNLFSEGDVKLGSNCTVLGSIFSQDRVTLSPYTTIGQPGKIKSVIGSRSVVLSNDVTVYGYVSTDGEGIVL